MITQQLLSPESIVVVGGSNDTSKPGGAVLRNLIRHGFTGKLYVTNLKENEVQGIKSFSDPSLLPDVDLAIIAIAAKYIPETVEVLAKQKNTKAFMVGSATANCNPGGLICSPGFPRIPERRSTMTTASLTIDVYRPNTLVRLG